MPRPRDTKLIPAIINLFTVITSSCWTSKGSDAKGGAKNYLVDGKMTAGFAALAYPAKYGDSGVMTFIVNQDGVVFQKDLGKSTEEIASTITEFNPDKSWSPVQ